MIIEENYKYILDLFDDSKFLERRKRLEFVKDTHEYKYDGKLISHTYADKLKCVIRVLNYKNINEEDFKEILAKKIMTGAMAVFESPSQKFGGAMNYFKLSMKMPAAVRNRILHQAAAIGTTIHKNIEKEIIETRTSKYLPEHFKPILVEEKLTDPEGKIAGTVDLIGWDTERKRIFILDWKTCRRAPESNERWKYEFQLLAYKRLFIRNFSPKVWMTPKNVDVYICFIDKKTLIASWLNIDKEIWE